MHRDSRDTNNLNIGNLPRFASQFIGWDFLRVGWFCCTKIAWLKIPSSLGGRVSIRTAQGLASCESEGLHLRGDSSRSFRWEVVQIWDLSCRRSTLWQVKSLKRSKKNIIKVIRSTEDWLSIATGRLKSRCATLANVQNMLLITSHNISTAIHSRVTAGRDNLDLPLDVNGPKNRARVVFRPACRVARALHLPPFD